MLGGLAAGVGFAGVTGVSAAAGTGPSSASHSSTAVPAHPARGLRGTGWRGPAGPGGIGGPGGRGGPGEGTILKVSPDGSGYELTVRTLRGTETVVTTSSTKVTGPDLQSTTLSSSDVGRVVRVKSKPTAPPASSSSSGSGTIDATGIRLVDSSVMGRVLKVGRDGYTLVGRNGQEIAVTTTSGKTRYLTGHNDGKAETTTSAPSYSVGEILFASGTETTTGSQSDSSATTTIAAVLVGKAPARPVGPPGRGPNPPGRPPAPPSRSGSSTGTSSATAA